jgi:hypothetical protein
MCMELTAHPKWPNGFRFDRHRLDGYVRFETQLSHRSHRRLWQPSRRMLLRHGCTATQCRTLCAYSGEELRRVWSRQAV